MAKKLPITKPEAKQRLTAFIDPVLVKRAKVQGALEGLTVSEIVERALDTQAPRIESSGDQHVHLNFTSGPAIQTFDPEIRLKRAASKKNKL